MAEGAALLVDTLLPPVPYRQWVLSFEGSLCVRLGYDKQLLLRVYQSFARRILQSIRHRVKRHHDLPSVTDLHPGLITVVQRFRGDLGLYVHLHVLAIDGAFPSLVGSHRWLAAPPLHDAELTRVLKRVQQDLHDVTDEATGDDVGIDMSLQACVQLSRFTIRVPSRRSPNLRRPSVCSLAARPCASTRRRRSMVAIALASIGFADTHGDRLLLTMPSKHSLQTSSASA